MSITMKKNRRTRVRDEKLPNLEIGIFNVGIDIGFMKIIVPISPPEGEEKKWLFEFYSNLRGKYWTRLVKNNYKCLICEKKFKYLQTLKAHLNKHIGWKVARCTTCDRKFFNLEGARNHAETCLQEHDQ